MGDRGDGEAAKRVADEQEAGETRFVGIGEYGSGAVGEGDPAAVVGARSPTGQVDGHARERM